MLCLFQDGVPWLIEKWKWRDKKDAQNTYIAKWPHDSPTAQLTGNESEEMDRARKQREKLEDTMATNEKDLKRKLADWYHKEVKRIRKQLAPEVTASNRDAAINTIIARNAQNDENMKSLMRNALQHSGL